MSDDKKSTKDEGQTQRAGNPGNPPKPPEISK